MRHEGGALLMGLVSSEEILAHSISSMGGTQAEGAFRTLGRILTRN